MDNEGLEIWKDVPGWVGLYQCSNLGNVRSLDRINVGKDGKQRFFNGKKMSSTISPDGYCCLTMRYGERKIKALLHRVIAETWIFNKYKKPHVNHINGIKTDNRIENLEWATARENNLHALNTKLRVMNMSGIRNPNYGKTGKLSSSSKPIIQLDLYGNFLAEFDGISDAVRKCGFKCTSNISHAIKNGSGIAHGFKWKFKHETKR